ncbi:MAG: hypothetical protein H0X16_09510, partial [Chloroflexi bacterium]|nr:hypothetical protein [Chloroflexota bacterium]
MTIFAREPGRGLRAPHTVLVVGSGAREHALCWKLAAEAGVKRVLVAPGNAGMGDVAETVPQVAAGDGAGLLELCGRERVDLVVIGPEGPLVDGVGDRLRTAGVATFGPDAAAAQIEGSKAFCRDIADAAGIPMAEGKAFDRLEPAYRYGQGLG